jgi:chromosome segregation ATPase
MIKKTAIVAGVALLLMGLLFGRDTASYLSTLTGWAQKTVHDSIPIDVELSRARQMISQLDPDIRDAMHQIAKGEVKVDQLAAQRDQLKDQLAKSMDDIDRLRTDLEREDSTYVYAGKSYTQRDVKSDLTRRWDLYKTRTATLEKMNAILDARMRGLKAATEKLAEMRAAKVQMEVDVENLEAQLELVKVAQAASDINLDDSHLARTKDLVSDIRTRIDVAQKLASAEDSYAGQIDLDTPESRDILDEIAQELDKNGTTELIVLER